MKTQKTKASQKPATALTTGPAGTAESSTQPRANNSKKAQSMQRAAAQPVNEPSQTHMINTAVNVDEIAVQSDQSVMSDDEDSAVLLRMESDVSLPKAPVKQLIMEKLPQSARIHQQSKDLISNLCMHFLMQLAEQANEFCSAQNKKTVCPDHVLDALTKMNLTRYFPKLAALDEEQLKQQALQQQAPPETKKTTKKRGGKNAAAQQAANASQEAANILNNPAKLRAAILTRLSQSMEGFGSKKVGQGKNAGGEDDEDDGSLNDEQKIAEQEKLFNEAREQYDHQNQMAMGHSQQADQSQPQIGGMGYDQDPNSHMMYDNNMVDMPMEPMMPPFIPTDYFRDMIFTTDFMMDGDAMAPNMQGQDDHEVPMTVDQEGNDIPAAEAPVDTEVDAPLQIDQNGVDHEARVEEAVIESFGFDDEELEELASESKRLTAATPVNEVAKVATAGSEAGAGQNQVADTGRNDDNTKPKEQNDQEMVEENKQAVRD